MQSLGQAPAHITSPVGRVFKGLNQPSGRPTGLSPQLPAMPDQALLRLIKSPFCVKTQPTHTSAGTITAFRSVGLLKSSQDKVREGNVTSEMEGGFCSTLSHNVDNNDGTGSKSLQLHYKLTSIPPA